jgi:hypothetical protein
MLEIWQTYVIEEFHSLVPYRFIQIAILLVVSYIIFRISLNFMKKVKLIWLGRTILVLFILLGLLNLGF